MSHDEYLPYGRHSIDDDDVAAVVAVLRSGHLTTGPAVAAFEAALGDILGGAHVVACNSGTAALHLAMLALGIGAGMRVVVPAVTFVATANAARYVGAEVVFADVDPRSGLMEAEHLAAALARCPGAHGVAPVHLNGQPGRLAEIAALARARGLAIVSDCCHALGTRYADGGCAGDGRFEDAAAFSFHPVKTVTMGEGGALATCDADLAQRARRARGHGIERNPDAFSQPEQAVDAAGVAQPWYYEQQSLGFNYRASDIACALGTTQLARLARFVERRRQLVARYDSLLAGSGLPIEPVARTAGVSVAWHLYAVLVDFDALGTGRGDFMRALSAAGIGTQVHYIPVYRQPFYRGTLDAVGLPGAEAYYARVLSLPLFPDMADADVDRVVAALAAACGSGGQARPQP